MEKIEVKVGDMVGHGGVTRNSLGAESNDRGRAGKK